MTTRSPKRRPTRALALICAIALVVAASQSLAENLIALPQANNVPFGDAAGDPNERPRRGSVDTFRIMQTEVTNAEFRAFVAATGHVTDPERSGAGYVWTDRWRSVRGADWRHPRGPNSSIAGRDDHPVVQVSQRDAIAYCRWRGLRLPTGDEWEYAARGTDGRRFPWGNQPPVQDGPVSQRRANFGTVPCCAADGSDGYVHTAPVGQFPAGRSPFGLDDMAGNVWEWVSDAFSDRPGQVALRGGGWGNNPYCLRTSYRHGNPPDIGLEMVGIRCAGDAI